MLFFFFWLPITSTCKRGAHHFYQLISSLDSVVVAQRADKLKVDKEVAEETRRLRELENKAEERRKRCVSVSRLQFHGRSVQHAAYCGDPLGCVVL